MKVFITGVTGVLGSTVTRLLVNSGHNVQALARNSANTSRLQEAGAEPIQSSLFDPLSLRAAHQDWKSRDRSEDGRLLWTNGFDHPPSLWISMRCCPRSRLLS